MRLKASFLLGFLLVVLFFSAWQAKFGKELILALIRHEQNISPLAQVNTPRPAVLGEVTTLGDDLNLGQPLPEKEVLAKGAFIYDLTAGRLVFEKDSKVRLQAASTIKIVTAAVALDKGKPDEELTVNLFPTFVGESSQNLLLGEKFTLDELLYGLFLVSGNDTAETIAQGLGGKREIFVDWMNAFTKRVGARETHFATPSGLDEEGQYTTAYDLYLLGNYIFRNYPRVLSYSTTKEKYLPKSEQHRAYLLKNKLTLSDEFSFLGGKTGLGEGNMLSLVALLEKNGHKLLVVLIQTPSIKHDLTQISNLF